MHKTQMKVWPTNAFILDHGVVANVGVLLSLSASPLSSLLLPRLSADENLSTLANMANDGERCCCAQDRLRADLLDDRSTVCNFKLMHAPEHVSSVCDCRQ